ncbi:MAG: hypothetical protein JO368_02220 [Acidimicrobiales bacterium]|nr:hypothetical protein [Acidimicrobiales bacterium]
MRQRLGLATGLCGLALVLTACNGGNGSGSEGDLASQSPSQIITSARQALSSAQSVRVTGHISQGSMTATLDITSFANGDYAGTFAVNGDSAQLKRIGGTDYLNASTSFYQSQGTSSATAQALGGRWVSGTDTQIGLGSDFSLRSLASQFTAPTGRVTKGPTGTVNGQTAVPLHSSSGTLWIATRHPNYPIQIVETGRTPGVVHFSDWNEGAAPTPPPGAVPVDSLSGTAAA